MMMIAVLSFILRLLLMLIADVVNDAIFEEDCNEMVRRMSHFCRFELESGEVYTLNRQILCPAYQLFRCALYRDLAHRA